MQMNNFRTFTIKDILNPRQIGLSKCSRKKRAHVFVATTTIVHADALAREEVAKVWMWRKNGDRVRGWFLPFASHC